jgi:putative endonuclease
MYTVYVLYSEKYNRLYIGYTSDLLNRFRSHQYLSTKGYTKKYRPWKVIYLAYFDTKNEAIRLEKVLKGGKGREWIRRELLPEMERLGFISA